MANKKMDPKLIAAKQKHEISGICKVVKGTDGKSIKVADLKAIMKAIAQKRKNYKPGDMPRSRAVIYAELRTLGYTTPGKKK